MILAEGRATIAAHRVEITQDQRLSAEALVCAIVGTPDIQPDVDFALQMCLFADAAFADMPPPPPGRILVQEALALEVRDAIRPGEQALVSGDRTSTPSMQLISLSARRVSAGTEPAALLTARLRLVEPATVAGQSARGSRRPSTAPLSATVEVEHLEAYATLSGDANPIHIDLGFARSIGLRERVVHGALFTFLIAPALRAAGAKARLRKLQMRFLGPAFAGEPLEVFVESSGSPTRDDNRARVLVIRSDGLICAVADVEMVA